MFERTNRVLTHKYGPEDWPFGQQRDGQVELLFKPIRVLEGTTMYARVFDPKDGSTYRTTAAPDDNLDTAAGTLSFSPNDTGSKSVSFSAGTEPLTTIYLNTTQFAAGDNYVVKASADPALATDPDFVCNAASGCVATSPVTVWKRVYLEKKQMFRSGVLVAGPAFAGSNEVSIQVPTGLRWNHVALRAGDSIRLLHAPRLNGLDFFPDFHSEDAVIMAVDRVPGARNRRLLTLAAPLAHSYSDDQSYVRALEDGVSDGVGNLAAGTYGRNEQYLSGSFAPAYVEFWPVEQGVSEIPYLPVVREAHLIANKWFENSPVNTLTRARPGNSNVKHVLAGSGRAEGATGTRLNPAVFGETGIEPAVAPPSTVNYIPQPNFSWTWVGAIERAVTLHGSDVRGVDPWIFNGENLAHELAHTFNVNSVFYYLDDFGHCSRTMVGNPALNCKMRGHEDPLYDARQAGDGIVGFHYSSDDDSEYMTIRRAWEPLATPAR